MGELSVVGIAPKGFAHSIVAAPWFARQKHRGVVAVGLQGIDTGDVVPVDDSRSSADDIVLVEALDDADKAVEAGTIHVLLAVPDGFTQLVDDGALFGCQRHFAESVGTDDVEGIGKLFVLLHTLEEIELRAAPVAKAVELHVAKAALVQRTTHILGELGVPAFLIVTAQGIELQTMHLAQAAQPGDVVVHHIVRPEIAYPCRGAPGCGIESQRTVATLGLAHHPPHIAAMEIGIAAPMAVRRHTALSGITVARHLYKHRADRSAEHGLEHQVHNLRALRLGIVLEQH